MYLKRKEEDNEMIKSRFKKSLTIALEEDMYNKIKEITAENYSSMGHYVRACINKVLEEENEFNKMNSILSD